MAKKQERRHRYSVMWKAINLDGYSIMVYVTDDLDDDLLAEHFVHALNTEDYEYAHACAAEAAMRGIEFIFPED